MGKLARYAVAGALIGAGAGAAAVGARRWYERLDADISHVEPHTARTEDGWNVAIHRRRPPGGSARPPIVCGHGLAGSHLIFDVTQESSFSNALADAGFDVWMLDWRGRGTSWPDSVGRPGLQWCFDDFVHFDLPAVVTKVLDVTGADRLFWIGHEMSGQVLYAAEIESVSDRIAAAVTMGAPAVTPPTAAVPGVTAPPKGRRHGRVPFRVGARFAGPALAYVAPRMLSSAFSPGLTDSFAVARYLASGAPDEARELVDQFGDWVDRGEMASRDRSVIYSDRLDEVRLPVMVVAGAVDAQRPPDAVKSTFEALGSADKRFVLAGRAAGMTADYGHDDLLTARRSRTEIAPLVCEWFERHS